MRKWLIRISRLANRFVYKEPCMVCASAFWQDKPSVKWFNRLFFWHENHSERCFSYEFQTNHRYYNHVMTGLKQKREASMQVQTPKPPPSLCAKCGDLVHYDDVLIKQFYNGRMVVVEHFCSDICHYQFYIERLNQKGL